MRPPATSAIKSIRKASRVHTRLRIKLGLVAMSAVALTACGLVQTAPAPAPAPAVAPAPAPAQSGQGSDTSGDSSQGAASLGQRSSDGGYWPASLQLGQSSSLGNVVLDGQGFTLYRFDKDTANPPKSNCSGTCAATWYPVLTKNTITFKNLNANALGAVQRPDGTQQVTVGNWPVYRYSKDLVPGQATGQGVGGTWYVVAPDGSKAGGGN
jgi:predicted lipoprotein with Yx(FWY)xxD motif